ncbi:MAG: hypothetical protein IPQ01_17895 [Zoogloea sp.]|nr:hypothetical protein [Zoogloea sp.]
MNAIRRWFGTSIAGKLNAALTVIISIKPSCGRQLADRYHWLGSLERRGVKDAAHQPAG